MITTILIIVLGVLSFSLAVLSVNRQTKIDKLRQDNDELNVKVKNLKTDIYDKEDTEDKNRKLVKYNEYLRSQIKFLQSSKEKEKNNILQFLEDNGVHYVETNEGSKLIYIQLNKFIDYGLHRRVFKDNGDVIYDYSKQINDEVKNFTMFAKVENYKLVKLDCSKGLNKKQSILYDQSFYLEKIID